MVLMCVIFGRIVTQSVELVEQEVLLGRIKAAFEHPFDGPCDGGRLPALEATSCCWQCLRGFVAEDLVHVRVLVETARQTQSSLRPSGHRLYARRGDTTYLVHCVRQELDRMLALPMR